MIDTGHKWFGQKILLESTGDQETDEALVSLFTDEWDGSGPLEISRPDSQIALAWRNRGENSPEDVPVEKQRAGQMSLFQEKVS